MHNPRNILITGASSGLGAALADSYAAPGVTLHLGGRDEARLATVTERCTNKGADVRRQLIDVTDDAALALWILRAADAAPLDLVIANAGVSGGTAGDGEDAAQTRLINRVNIDGVVNTVMPALDIMRNQEGGQIAIISSLASFLGYAGAPAYCGSKAAVRVWGEGLRRAYGRAGIEISVICPGFITTPMTTPNPYPMPMIMPAARAAGIIRRGLTKNRGRIAFPLSMYALTRLIAALPSPVIDRLMRDLPRKD